MRRKVHRKRFNVGVVLVLNDPPTMMRVSTLMSDMTFSILASWSALAFTLSSPTMG